MLLKVCGHRMFGKGGRDAVVGLGLGRAGPV